MAGAARENDVISGVTDNNHVIIGYDGYGNPIYGSSSLNGTISSGSQNVFVNSISAAYKGSQTTETDAQDSSSGIVSSGSSNVFVNGKPFARNGDTIQPHSGTATIISGSSNVFINN